MRLPEPARVAVLRWAIAQHMSQRPPDFIIGPSDHPYLLRWFVVREGRRWLGLSRSERADILERENQREDRGGGINIYVHRFLQSDDARALHDHPWSWRTIVLKGQYREYTPADPSNPSGLLKSRVVIEGSIGRRRKAFECHRVELIEGDPVTTLFITGRKEREWGFHCAQGWRHWSDYITGSKGCG